MDILFIFVFGLIIGSFLNVCICRIPQGEPITFPPSRCTYCHERIRPYDLVPVVSFFILKGKCRSCGGNISCRYPGVELLTGCLFLIDYLFWGLTPILIPYLIFTALFIVITWIDIDTYLIPDGLIIFGFASAIILRVFIPFVGLWDALLGFFLGGGSLFLIALVSKGGMGGGDIKLAALMGFFLGWQQILVALFLAAVLCSMIGLVLVIKKKKKLKDPIPFGPFLALGGYLSLLFGSQLIRAYLSFFFS